MQELVMKNWGPFHMYLQEMRESLGKDRQEEIDPYKQLLLDNKKKLLIELEANYVSYLKIVGDDLGLQYLTYLYNKLQEFLKLANSSNIDYMQVVYSGLAKMLALIVKEFKEFRLRP